MNSETAVVMEETSQKESVAVIKRAIISVSDKTGLAEFAKRLEACGVEIFSTGGTSKHLVQAGVQVRDVSDYTRFPEMMDGRVKTLHPKIFGGILCRRDNPQDLASVEEHGMVPLDLVVVNLYPFAETVARPDCDRAMAIENIDIGGPSLVRAAAKNNAFVTIATSPSQYDAIVDELDSLGGTSQKLRHELMAAAFQHTAEYDQMIAGYFQSAANSQPAELKPTLELKMTRTSELRYGENSHQAAALYEISNEPGVSLARMEQLNGKELSFNNLLDVNSGLNMVSSFEEPACVVIKHNNPCGAAAGGSLADVVRRAFAGDPVSAFGSIVAVNREMDVATAEMLATGDYFIEAIVCTGFNDDALKVLQTQPKWKKNVRLLKTPMVSTVEQRLDMRRVHGGMLVQQADALQIDPTEWQIATGDAISDELQKELAFAWNMVRFVKSNAIVLGKNQALCGVGAGQMSRVDAVRIAIEKAGGLAPGSVLASDAFFPFPDSIEIASQAGIAAVIQPGGSVKDGEVVAACKQYGIPMVLTGRRHFLH